MTYTSRSKVDFEINSSFCAGPKDVATKMENCLNFHFFDK